MRRPRLAAGSAIAISIYPASCGRFEDERSGIQPERG
jgi:hypothetical protein